MRTGGVVPAKATSVDLLVRAAEGLLDAAQNEAAVLRTAVDLLGDRFGYDMRYILLWRPERKVLEMVEVGGRPGQRAEVRAFTTQLGVGLTGRCAESLRTISVPDVREDPRYVAAVAECVSELCVPIAVGHELLGVLALESAEPSAFTHEDETAVEAFSKLLALALTQARASARSRRDIEVLEAVNEVAASAATFELQRTLDVAVRSFQRLTSSDSTAIYLYEPATRELYVSALIYQEALYPKNYEQTVRERPLPLGEGVVGWTALHRQPALIDDVSKDPRARRMGDVPLEAKSAIAFPLIADERLVGVIRAAKMGVATYGEDQFRLAQTFASQTALAIAATQAHEEAKQLSLTDELTGVANARHLKRKLDGEVTRAIRYDRPLSVLIIDSDSLKRVNDKFGHDAGDRLLVGVAAAIQREMRSTDFVARYGGDEFVAILPETDLGGASSVARRLAQACATPDEAGTVCTVSIGVAALEPGLRTGDDLFHMADTALYRAKRLGKNRVETSSLLEANS
jgi:diguanylate cyclase (GGDEF)-like protein